MDKARFLFFLHFVDILEAKVFTEGILDISFYHSLNQKILSTAYKKPFLSCF